MPFRSWSVASLADTKGWTLEGVCVHIGNHNSRRKVNILNFFVSHPMFDKAIPFMHLVLLLVKLHLWTNTSINYIFWMIIAGIYQVTCPNNSWWMTSITVDILDTNIFFADHTCTAHLAKCDHYSLPLSCISYKDMQ